MTIFTTKPTRHAVVFDIPEPTNFACEFNYNFYVSDESFIDTGIDVQQFQGETNDIVQSKLIRTVPRYVYLTWTKPTLVTANNQTTQFYATSQFIAEVNSLSDVYDDIMSETEFSTSQFTPFSFQDNTLDGKLFALASGTVVHDANLFNKGLQTAYNATIESISDTLKLSPNSLLDAAKLISSGQDQDVDNLLVDALVDVSKLNADYIDDEKQKVQTNQRFETIKNAKLDVQLNTKFAYTALYNVVTDPLGTYADEFAPIIQKIRNTQISAINATNTSVTKFDDYELYIEPQFVLNFSSSNLSFINSFDTPRKLVGYIIDRYEINADGTRTKLDPIIVDGIDKTTAYDTRIKYGKKYCYEIRSVLSIQFVIIQDNQTAQLAIIFVKSQPLTYIIDTIEMVPPPWPADFQISWDRARKRPRLMWSFPPNQQRDVKKFQIFRRSNIDEPYQLLKEYDFDDNMMKYSSGETSDPQLIEKVVSPPLHYIDQEFEVNSKFMYTLGCVDAHGLVSNFSSQIEIVFDPIKNGVKRRLVSGPNAPRPYPNMYVKQDDVIIDLIRDSRHSKIKLYFDPEYADVRKPKPTGSGSTSLKLLALSNPNSTELQPIYKLQILNADLQQAKTLDIIVEDRRQVTANTFND